LQAGLLLATETIGATTRSRFHQDQYRASACSPRRFRSEDAFRLAGRAPPGLVLRQSKVDPCSISCLGRTPQRMPLRVGDDRLIHINSGGLIVRYELLG